MNISLRKCIFYVYSKKSITGVDNGLLLHLILIFYFTSSQPLYTSHLLRSS